MVTAASSLPQRRVEHLDAAYRTAVRAKRRRALLFAAAFAVAVILAAISAEVDLLKLADKIGNFTSYLGRIFHLDDGRLVFADIGEWYWGISKWSRLLLETLIIAYVGTALGAAGALLVCFAAAANLMPKAWIRVPLRRFLEFCRTVPELVFALIFVIAFGLGPIPGLLAIAIHTFGALGKQFFEVAENIDMKPVEGVTATGASWPVAVRFGALPQVAANFVSYALLRFEINVRGASILGFVGAGGIGQDLIEAIRKFYYSDVSAILLLIIATVVVIDLVTEQVRHRLIEVEARR
ncbi:phosphonate ABC transporter, permease protein PhnE [Desertibaculum subflavum]|uniref:phosphonate ABC transporter, permease protein PhnE n=1 Tax=Desertibaculum subflavum TaxID=2268458 RepID=UPI000E667AB8